MTFQKVRSSWNKGKKMVHSGSFKKGHKGYINSGNFKKGQLIGEKNINWKGDEVGLGALHSWVERNLGKPDNCEHCGKSKKDKWTLDWANKGHTYKRNLNDWLRLCRSCHRKYDRKVSLQRKTTSS